MKGRLLALLLALAMMLSLAACGGTAGTNEPSQEPSHTAETPSAEPSPAEETPRADFVFTDDCGRQVEVPGEVSRIVPSGPLAQIVLYTIAPEMLVGLGAKWSDSAKGIVHDEYLDLPYFGQLYGSANLNVEELAKVDPQLIIDTGEAKSSVVEDMDSLQSQTTIPAVFVSATLETMPETYRKLGQLLNKEEEAEELAQLCERVYSRTVSIMEKVGDDKVNALYVLGEEGLNVLAYDSYQSKLIDMLTNNLAVVEKPVSKGTGNEVSMEQIALWNPDFIIFAPGSIYSTVSGLDTWREITAVANGDYIEVPEGPHNWMGSPPSVQRYLGMIWLTSVLYPQYCDYDVKAEILEFYSLFYHCDLTEEQYETLTANAYLNKN
ncbi:MAG: ABC transporter substrate-binding protein [Oscillospiraceae bacterium]